MNEIELYLVCPSCKITEIKFEKNKYFCEKCDYGTSKKSSYIDHTLSAKHKKAIDFNEILPKICSTFLCKNCDKIYKDYSGLWRHKKKCLDEKEENINEEKEEIKTHENEDIDLSDTNLILALIQQNNELQKQMLEVIKNGTNNTVNSHNKTFNLQFFLNETCKNAMNISEFVDSIKLQISDLENVGKIGYVEGLSKIIITKLNALDVTERPVHCSDTKRDTMYVKDDDKWEKEEEDNHIILKAIEDIANKNTKQIKEWKKLNPECASSKSHKADVYSHIMIQVLCANNDANNHKVLKKIAKEVAIDKK